MTTVRIRGFTIIELMLFLAVSGGLFAALLLGVNNGITQQRYKDSVYAFSSFLKNQYSEVLNTRNEARTSPITCNDSTVLSVTPAAADPRGASKCVILGKAIVAVTNTTDQKTTIKAYTVFGTCTPPDTTNDNCATNDFKSDIDALTSYNPKIITDATVVPPAETSLEWGSWLYRKDSRGIINDLIASYLILRSPQSGLVKVFTSYTDITGVRVILADLIRNDPLSTTTVCVENPSKGLQPTYSVTVDPAISGPNAVVVKVDGIGC